MELVGEECVRVNEAWQRATGSSRESTLRGGYLDAVHPEDLARLLEQQERLATGLPRSKVFVEGAPHRRITPNGSINRFTTKLRVSYDESGIRTRSFVALVDITEQHEPAERAKQLETGVGSAVPLAIFDLQGDATNCEYANSRWAELTGQNLGSATGRGWMKRIHPDDLLQVQATHARCCTQSHDHETSYEVRYFLPNGKIRWLQTNLTVVSDDTGSPPFCIATLADISTVKQEVDHLHRASNHIKHALEVNGIGVWQWLWDENRVVWDDQMFSIYGLTREEFGGTYEDWANRLHPDDYEHATRVNPCRDSSSTFSSNNFRILRPCGEIRHIYATAYNEHDRTGHPTTILGLNIDVTPLRKVTRSLKSAEDQLQRIAENIPGVVFQFRECGDGIYSFLYISQKVEEFYGVRASKVLEDASSLFDVIHSDDLDRVIAAIRQSSDHLTAFQEEYRIVVPGKIVRWVRVIGQPHRVKEADTIWDGVVIDISDRKKAEHAELEARKRIDRINDNLPGIVWSFSFPTNGEPRCTFITSKCEQMYGASVEQALTDPHSLGVWQSPEVARHVTAELNEAVAELKPLKMYLRVDPPGQEPRWHQVYGQPKKLPNGDVVVDGVTLDVTSHKEAEKALDEVRDRFRRMTENIPGTVYQHIERTDGSSAALYVSQQVQDLYGVTAEQATRDVKCVFDTIHPDDVGGLLHAIEETSETLKPINHEYRIVVPGRDVKWVRDISQPHRTEEGHTIWDGVVFDITEKKRAEQELLEAKRLTERIAGNLPGMVFRHIYHASGGYRCSFITSRCYEMFGVSAEEALEDATTLLKWFDPDVVESLGAKIDVAVTQLESLVAEYRVNPPGEKPRWYQVHAQPTQLADGNVALDGVVLDVTDRKEAEMALEESQKTFRGMTENVPGMIFQFVLHADGTSHISYASSQSREIYGLTPQQLVEEAGQCMSRIHPDDLDAVATAMRESAKTLDPYKMEYRVVLPGRGEQWRQATSRPRRNDAGGTIWDGVVIDITERKEHEIKLQHANDELAKATRLKDEFLATISHELRTPLTAILCMTEGLAGGLYGPLTASQRHSVEVIGESGGHLLELINDVLDLAMIESGQTALEVSEIDVRELCRAVVGFVKPQARKKSISVNANVPLNLPTLSGDQKRVRQILLNLLTNAVKFTKERGSVLLLADFVAGQERSSQPAMRFCVTDSGIGIEESEISVLFEPFCRVAGDSPRGNEGTGLGLALVKKYVDLHGGEVRVSSQVGVGSSFTVELPLENTASLHGVGTQPVESRPSRPTDGLPRTSVLLVEDNPAVAASMVAYLEATSHLVKVVDNGIAAIESAEEIKPDVILMDIQLPGISGLEAIRRIRQVGSLTQTPIIALTGRAMRHDDKKCLDAGANDYISKPCSMELLTTRIRKMVTASRL